MILAVPPENVDALLKLFSNEDVEATVIGEFTGDKRLQLYYRANMVCDMDMEFLHKGLPQYQLQASWSKPPYAEPEFPLPQDLESELLAVLGGWNVCSKEWVIRQYDHEVQGGSVLKPLVGRNNDGPGDAAVIRPILSSDRGAIVSCGINTRYGDIDPYWMAASAIDEALRQIVSVGGNLNRVAVLDNFCWGSAGRPEMLGALVRAAQACHDMSLGYEVPFISGKDSLNNEFEYEGKTVSIPHTLLISGLGIMEDVNKAVSMDLKTINDLIYIVGLTQNELGGSEYYHVHGSVGSNVPRVDPLEAKKNMNALSAAMALGLVAACHDCSDGGLGVAIAEMAFASGMGASIYLKSVPKKGLLFRDDFILFSETNSRFLVEVDPQNDARFQEAMQGVTMAHIGHVSPDEVLEVYGLNNAKILKVPLVALKKAWQKPLRW